MRRFTVVLLLFVIALPAFCDKYSPRVEVKANADFYHSKLVSESIKYRTSFNVDGDILPLYFESSDLGYGAGISLAYTSRSLAFGSSILKPYRSIGAVIGMDWHAVGVFSIGLKARLMISTLGPVYVDKFAAVEVELEPSVRLVDKNRLKLNVLVPLTAVIRKDGYCLRAGLGFGVNM